MEQADTARPPDAISAALSEATALLRTDAAAAGRIAFDVLKSSPGHARALMLFVSAKRIAGDKAGARAALEALALAHPDEVMIHHELGLIANAMKDHNRAATAFSRVITLEPDYRDAWRLFGDALIKTGQAAEAGEAYVRNHELWARRLEKLEAAADDGRGPFLLRYLAANPTDVNISLLAAQLEIKVNRFGDAEARLVEVLRLVPDFRLARFALAQALHRQTKAEEAIRQLDILLETDPRNVACLNLKGLALSHLGDYARALAYYEKLLGENSNNAAYWVSYGHVLKTVGRFEDAVAAMRKAIALRPNLGEAYWQLADLKIYRFTEVEIVAMQGALAGALSPRNRALIHFALGKALEDAKDYRQSFEEYAKGNAERRALVQYAADAFTAMVERSEALFTKEFFLARAASGDAAPDPIFIVGLTRSGSTLIEQMLSAHPQIEGTAELPAMDVLVAEIRTRFGAYPGGVGELDRDALARLGAEYIARTRAHRKTSRPFFIDKMPANFRHTGLIHLILPNAKIIDARRHPMSCGFANFKQHFTHGQAWSYDLEEIGRYYHDYVALMAHFDAVLPGRVHRVLYEDVVADPEREVRRLLDYCGLPFDEACLRFYENDRPVLSASAEQVRRPIFQDGLDQWRHYEPWLDPLKAALGAVLDAYPAAPSFQRNG